MPIYFKEAEGNKSIIGLLKRGFIGGGYYKGFVETFSDQEFKITQCEDNAKRSFGDLLEICQTYFPKTTKEKLARVLINKYSCLYCCDVGKLVWYFNEDKDKFEDDYYKSGDDNICYDDILKWSKS